MLGALVAGLMLLVSAASADNIWNGFHWEGSELPLTVKDRTGAPYNMPATIGVWNALGTPAQGTIVSKGKGQVTAKEVKGGFFLPWFGLAEVLVNSDGHIQEGRISLNVELIDYAERTYGVTQLREKVASQEYGHIIGLDHNRDATTTSMNDCPSANPDSAWFACVQATGGTTPNLHDGVTLAGIYAHSSAEAGDPPSETDDEKGGPPCSKFPDKPNCDASKSGRWVTVHVFLAPNFD